MVDAILDFLDMVGGILLAIIGGVFMLTAISGLVLLAVFIIAIVIAVIIHLIGLIF